MFYVTLNKRNPVTFRNIPTHARAHYCSTHTCAVLLSFIHTCAESVKHASSLLSAVR